MSGVCESSVEYSDDSARRRTIPWQTRTMRRETGDGLVVRLAADAVVTTTRPVESLRTNLHSVSPVDVLIGRGIHPKPSRRESGCLQAMRISAGWAHQPSGRATGVTGGCWSRLWLGPLAR